MGIFVRAELERAVQVVEATVPRVLWFSLSASSDTRGSPSTIICACYPAPGGDVVTWSAIVQQYRSIRARFPLAHCFIAGDCNTHLSYVVQHAQPCTCLHCRQSAADKDIERLITEVGLVALNPPMATHVSGTCIDLFLGPSACARPAVRVHAAPMVESDHALVLLVAPVQLQANFANGLSRVAWTAGPAWEEGLACVPDLLEALSAAVGRLVEAPWCQPFHMGGNAPRLVRLALLDGAAWARDVIITLVGHAAGATRAVAPARRPRVKPPCLVDPEAHAGHDTYRRAVARATWTAHKAVIHKYAQLRRDAPNEAERYIAKFFSAQQAFEIALVQPSTGESLDCPGMVAAVEADLRARADNDFPHDPAEQDAQRRVVSAIRTAGAVDPVPHAGSAASPLRADCLYTPLELEAALDSLKESSSTARGCYAAVRAPSAPGRRLTLALMNLARRVCLTSAMWSLRHIVPLHKSGPRVVRKVDCLRPISVSCDMAGVQDALWLSRNAGKLEAYAGAAQQGGVGDPLSLVLALVIQAQLRAAQNLPTWWALTDLRWAFDVASRPAMLIAAFAAGITGADWLILDDTFTQDRLCVVLHGCLGGVFLLGAGTAQGRRFSARVFNGQLRWLADEVENVLPRGCASLIPPPYRRMLAELDAACPVPSSAAAAPAPPASPGKLLGLAEEVVRVAAAEEPPWPLAQAHARRALAACAEQADRAAIVNALGTVPLPPVQYSDDLAAPCPSPGALRAIVSVEPSSARSLYARRTRAHFNYAAGKTAVMALCGSPDPGMVGAPVVTSKTLLGVLVDSGLTFSPLLSSLLARGHAMFEALMHAAETGGFPPPVTAAQVPTRIVSALSYSAPLLAATPRAFHALNELQVAWARRLLGCRTACDADVPGPVVVTQCGWTLRLGTLFQERCIMARARLLALPPEHPGARVFVAARATTATTWVAAVGALMQKFPGGIPDLDLHPLFGGQALGEARANPAARRKLLKAYRLHVVRPALLQHDAAVFYEAAAPVMPALGFSYSAAVPEPQALPWSLLDLDLGPSTWLAYRTWATVRVSGRWPLTVLGGSTLPSVLPSCAACGAEHPVVSHPLCACPGTAHLRRALEQEATMPPLSGASLYLLQLFRDGPVGPARAAHVRFVHAAVLCAVAPTPSPG